MVITVHRCLSPLVCHKAQCLVLFHFFNMLMTSHLLYLIVQSSCLQMMLPSTRNCLCSWCCFTSIQWAKTWLLCLHPDKYQSIVLSINCSLPIPCYCIDTNLVSSRNCCSSHLNWNDYCKHVAAKATQSLNFLCHCLFHYSNVVKSIAYKCVVQTTGVCLPSLASSYS